MTIQTENNTISHTADGLTQSFIYDFIIPNLTDVVVYEDGEITAEAYTVTGLGDPSGGTVDFTTYTPADGVKITIQREMPLTQVVDYQPYDPFPAETHEAALDKLTMITQQLDEEVNRAMRMPPGTSGIDLTLPLPEAEKALVWNETEDALKNSEYTESQLIAAEANAVAAASQAAASASAAAISAATAIQQADRAESEADRASGYANTYVKTPENHIQNSGFVSWSKGWLNDMGGEQNSNHDFSDGLTGYTYVNTTHEVAPAPHAVIGNDDGGGAYISFPFYAYAGVWYTFSGTHMEYNGAITRAMIGTSPNASDVYYVSDPHPSLLSKDFASPVTGTLWFTFRNEQTAAASYVDVWDMQINTSGIAHDTGLEDNVSRWVVTSGASIVWNAGGYYEYSGTTGSPYHAYFDDLSVVKDRFYRVSATIKKGTSDNPIVKLFFNDGVEQSAEVPITGTFTEFSHVFQAASTSTTAQIGIILELSNGDTIEYKLFEAIEVVPYVKSDSSNLLGPDFWSLNTTGDLWRDPDNIKAGQSYSLKVLPSVQYTFLNCPNIASYQSPEWVAIFKGKTVTYGVWVYCEIADAIRIGFYDTQFRNGVFHGGTGWEWLEHTITVDVAATQFRAYLYDANASAPTQYNISHPHLAIAVQLGQDNYEPAAQDVRANMVPYEEFRLHGRSFDWDQDRGYLPVKRDLSNLMQNTGWDVNSRSTVGEGATVTEDDCSVDRTSEWVTNGDSITFSVDHYKCAASVANRGFYRPSLSVKKGRVYEISIDVKDGTATGIECRTQLYDGADHVAVTFTTTGSWVTHKGLIRASSDSSVAYAGIWNNVDLAGNNIEIRNFKVTEAVPAYVAANDHAPDGFYKDTLAKLYRVTDIPLGGEKYSIKMVPNGVFNFFATPTTTISESKRHIDRFLNKWVTFGVFCKAYKAGNAKISLNTATHHWSRHHSGNGEWEWLETTAFVDESATRVRFMFYNELDQPDADIIWSSPMVVFGPSIGEGNYQRSHDKRIWFEIGKNSNLLHGKTHSTSGGFSAIDLEIDSDLAISKEIKDVYITTVCRDSGSAVNDCRLFLRADSVRSDYSFIHSVTGLANGATNYQQGRVYCDPNGDIQYYIDASGVDTFDTAGFQYLGVTLR